MPQPVVRRNLESSAGLLLSQVLPPAAPPDGWRLLSHDFEQGLCLTFARGDELVYVEVEARNEAQDCYLRTEAFNVCARPLHTDNRDIGPGGRDLMAWIAAGLRAKETLLLQAPRPTPARRSLLREIEVDRLLTVESPGQYYINPYVGCTIGCSFCYVGPRADLSRRIEGLPKLDWGYYVDVKVNAAEVLAKEVQRNPPGLVRMSPILTDPYQPAERKYRITRQCLEVLQPAGFTPVILTRAQRILDDLDLLASFRDPMAGLSIPTDDDAMRQIFEPGADTIDQRIDALQKLHAAGVVTLVVVQPMLPMNVDRLLERIAPYTDVVRVDRMHFALAQKQYEEHGLQWASQESWFRQTYERLIDGFRAAGTLVDEMDNMAALRDAAVAQRARKRRAATPSPT